MPSGDLTKEPLAPDTIAAIATPPGRGGIGVVRVSGSRVPDIARVLLGVLPKPRAAVLATVRNAGGDKLDRGLALYFPAPHSYTGEDVLEFQGHGGPVVMQAVLGAVLDAGARLADPGEYTRRAFLNDCLDLAQAEAVADLIDAASSEAARSAMRSLDGEFSAAVRQLVAELTELRALTEAMLDFPEEEVDELHRDDAHGRLASTRTALETVLARSRQGRLLREGLHVVIAGRPNVGKSSLLNRLAGAERAIVTPVAGTTRDLVREDIRIEGVPLHVVDTAGLRDAADPVEKIGIERAWQEIGRADVVLAVQEAGTPRDDGALSARLEAILPGGAVRIRVVNKIDLAGVAAGRREGEVRLSARTGEGIDLLREALLEAAGWTRSGESVFLARERHLRALGRARTHLAAAAAQGGRWELFAEELRLAQEALSEITGEVTSEDLLGEIFGRFCIGK
ncbi:MAG: tRNA uridine-5-carboxymethylaminomethyl(34) synthesis GTPase MnmE [Betaproteobacteria bacterium]